jgi:hypothetical protein
MVILRHTANVLFSLLLVGFMAMELAEAFGTFEGSSSVLALDFDSEESEESQEEEREGPEEKKDKSSEDGAFLHGHRLRLAAEVQRLHAVLPPSEWDAMVAAKIWEPPEMG